MADNFTQMRVGEKEPIYGYVTMPNGTCTIQPTPTCILKDSVNATVSGFNGINVTGFEPGALQTAKMWLNLDASTLTPGYYFLTFTANVLGSDGMTRVREPSMEIQILALNA